MLPSDGLGTQNLGFDSKMPWRNGSWTMIFKFFLAYLMIFQSGKHPRHWNTLKNHQNLPIKNTFFGRFLIPKNLISGSRSVTAPMTHFFLIRLYFCQSCSSSLIIILVSSMHLCSALLQKQRLRWFHTWNFSLTLASTPVIVFFFFLSSFTLFTYSAINIGYVSQDNCG